MNSRRRQRAVLRIDRFQLSAFNQELRAPSAHRTLEDPRTNQPSRTSLGGHADLRLIQPIDRVELNLRGTAAYTRDLFGEDEDVAALDKESLDDWTLTAEIIPRQGGSPLHQRAVGQRVDRRRPHDGARQPTSAPPRAQHRRLGAQNRSTPRGTPGSDRLSGPHPGACS